MGTILVSLILISAVALIIRSMIKAKRSGKSSCSCGGNCSACGQKCSGMYPHLDSLIEKQKAKNANTIYERHTILTQFFEQIGVKSSIASSDACKIEHDISPETFKAIKKLVNAKETE